MQRPMRTTKGTLQCDRVPAVHATRRTRYSRASLTKEVTVYPTDTIGVRVRTLRVANDMSQTTLARALGGETNSLISKIETGRLRPTSEQLDQIAAVLDCTPEYLLTPVPEVISTRPWLRAYADAPAKTVQAAMADNEIAYEWAERASLRRLPDAIPDLSDDAEDPAVIEAYAREVRDTLGLDTEQPVRNAIRAAEKLGCVVLPLADELGRHLGISQYINSVPHIRVSRARANVPGDRQRFTVAHELGHLGLHAGSPPPTSADDARRLEAQAHRFAGAFLTPEEPLLEDLESLGGRVTLATLQELKSHWGVAIKMLVVRLRQLDRISSDQATSLYKQISKRGWNTGEPVPVTNEHAVWLTEALTRQSHTVNAAAGYDATGLSTRFTERWFDWYEHGPHTAALDAPRSQAGNRDHHASRFMGVRVEQSSGGNVITLRPRQ